MLAAQLPDFAPILHFESCDSTQTALAAHLLAQRGLPGHWHLAIADAQTAGRGRTGARWLAPPGAAVLMTLAAPLPVPLDRWPRASLVAGLAAAEVLGAAVRLKWPNDLLVHDGSWRKLGGILCERLETPPGNPGKGGPWWLCGIGVNVSAVPAALAAQAAALGTGEDRLAVAARLARGIRQRISHFVASQGQLPLAELHTRLAFRGAPVVLEDGWQGPLHGLADDGGLRVGDRVVHAGAIVAAGGAQPWQAALRTV